MNVNSQVKLFLCFLLLELHVESLHKRKTETTKLIGGTFEEILNHSALFKSKLYNLESQIHLCQQAGLIMRKHDVGKTLRGCAVK